MKRRDLLKNTASASMLAFGATTAASATETPSLDGDTEVSVLNEQGERVTMSLSDADVDPEDCCYGGSNCQCVCQCCYC